MVVKSTMSMESLNRTSDVIETPRVNVDVLKQRLVDQKKKDKLKKTIIFFPSIIK